MTVRVNFWDTAGGAAYFPVRNEFYRDADGLLLVFDVGSRPSFDHVDRWLDEMAQCLQTTKSDLLMETSAVLLGNKVCHGRGGCSVVAVQWVAVSLSALPPSVLSNLSVHLDGFWYFPYSSLSPSTCALSRSSLDRSLKSQGGHGVQQATSLRGGGPHLGQAARRRVGAIRTDASDHPLPPLLLPLPLLLRLPTLPTTRRYFETSASTGQHVDEAFEHLLNKIQLAKGNKPPSAPPVATAGEL